MMFRKLKNGLKRKLRSARGETLTETLCAVLITGLAASLLALMVGAASRIDRTSSTAEQELYSDVTAAETGALAPAAGSGNTLTVTVTTGEEGTPGHLQREVEFTGVTFYGDAETLSYYRWEGRP